MEENKTGYLGLCQQAFLTLNGLQEQWGDIYLKDGEWILRFIVHMCHCCCFQAGQHGASAGLRTGYTGNRRTCPWTGTWKDTGTWHRHKTQNTSFSSFASLHRTLSFSTWTALAGLRFGLATGTVFCLPENAVCVCASPASVLICTTWCCMHPETTCALAVKVTKITDFYLI